VPRANLNPHVVRDSRFSGLFTSDEYELVERFYSARRDLAPTPLRPLAALANNLGLRHVLVKDETARFGLSAFKSLGVRYALDRLSDEARRRGLACATAGNHGRAVARAARDLRAPCTVFVPRPPAVMTDIERTVRMSRIDGMRDDGAQVVEVDGSYEEAVGLAAAHGERTGATVVSDTSWAGYEDIPRAIMAGYTHMFAEAEEQWAAPPDVVLVQAGVGGLVCAAASWFAWRYGASRPFIVACEPDGAACLLASAAAGELARLPAAETMMAGLRCAEPSPVAWPPIRQGVDAFVSVPDSLAVEAMQILQSPEEDDPPIASGPSGACGIASLLALARESALERIRRACGFGRSTRALAVVTEGVR
jgi:diaminopropionate ammonia-lyase